MEETSQKKSSDSLLVGLLLLAIVVSFFGTYLSVMKLRGIPLTGLVTTGTTQLNVTRTVSIVLSVSTVDFGNKVVTNADDTTDNSPPPFTVVNNGNVNVNVTVNASPLFTGTTSNATDYRFRCSNSESVCNGAGINTFTAFNQTTTSLVMVNLSFPDTNDSENLEISIVVPDDETPGAKTSTVTFTASSFNNAQ